MSETDELAKAYEALRMSGASAEEIRAFARIRARGVINTDDFNILGSCGIDMRDPRTSPRTQERR